MAIVRVIEAFADFSSDPNGRLFQQGLLVDDSDPAVVKHPSRFEPVEAAAVRATETAVSAPGLRRSLSRPERHHGRDQADKGTPAKPAKPAKRAAAKKAPAKKAAPAPAPATDGTETL